MTKIKQLPSQQYLQECFTYDPETGLLYWKTRPENHFKDERIWKIWNTRFSGKEALTSKCAHGYLHGSLNNVSVKAHRVIWKLWYGTEPKIILHSKGNKTDNRIEKLSSGTKRDNALDRKKYDTENSSGVTGVFLHTPTGKWRVQIGIGEGINKHLGLFENLEEAARVRRAAEVEYGYHPDHGKR